VGVKEEGGLSSEKEVGVGGDKNRGPQTAPMSFTTDERRKEWEKREGLYSGRLHNTENCRSSPGQKKGYLEIEWDGRIWRKDAWSKKIGSNEKMKDS